RFGRCGQAHGEQGQERGGQKPSPNSSQGHLDLRKPVGLAAPHALAMAGRARQTAPPQCGHRKAASRFSPRKGSLVLKADVIVLGAGIVGVSAAVHLLKLGRNVMLIDRRAPGEETSLGNAGVIEREGFVPVTFPRDPVTLLRYAAKRATEVNY